MTVGMDWIWCLPHFPQSNRWKHFCSDWSNSACSRCADVTCPAGTREPQHGFSTPSHGPAWTTVIIQGWPQSCSFVGLAAPETDKKIKPRFWAVSPLNLKPGNSWASEVSDDTEICHSSALASGITDCKYCIAYILDFCKYIFMFYFSLFTTAIFALGKYTVISVDFSQFLLIFICVTFFS